MVILIMGVSGVGKSTVGRALAARLGWVFLDADNDHPAANVAKMRSGIPLSDDDREPWLAAVGARVRRHERRGEDVVLACSALKATYRERLREFASSLITVFLTAPKDMLAERIANRAAHFMHENLLQSQLSTLEPPAQDATTIEATGTPDEIVDHILRRTDLRV